MAAAVSSFRISLTELQGDFVKSLLSNLIIMSMDSGSQEYAKPEARAKSINNSIAALRRDTTLFASIHPIHRQLLCNIPTITPEFLDNIIYATGMNKEHIRHCLSQLKRFVGYFMRGDMSRTLQFGYNLGRLQEMCTTPYHTIFWQPIEHLYNAGNWIGLNSYIDTL